MNNGPVYVKSFGFSLKIISLYKKLADAKEYILSKQLLRCGTSIGANVNEASAAQSKNDFIAKMSIASKEARETLYWLRLLKEARIATLDYCEEIALADEMVKIITAIVKTAQAKR